MARIVRYGADAGPVAIYFHGVPGAPEECARFDAAARADGVRLLGIDRGSLADSLGDDAHFSRLADEVAALSDGGPLHLIGFSLGAFVALRVAAHLGVGVASLDLVSAAAPLELGDVLDEMAGKPVFAMARRSPRLLGVMTAAQGWLAQVAPGRLFGMLFATAAGEDRALAADPAFRSMIGEMLRQALGPGRPGYLRDVQAYVAPWAGRLGAVAAETRLWHGREDNWAPPAMADSLARVLPAVSQIEIEPGLSHYSCLFWSLPRILARIGDQRG
ncbi:MAG: alpha/beta hydrolase [Alphaproteobacteria bacterium]|nr:alpha/beta hydrolase [Alphaproteobacteria bacterium]MBU1512743.1 alpha/beta hydrolase [Alphaproteobacteria bacterium]MBU2096122.1 alpha/beta hydrolase [Alphaproteobacteria bacterium]MBU2152478.1 alpha/beta hydrolase [Alphaproteobacteria bacterium]MBU2307988.1 alpha/beta hydrolase [Alphaproteobacteria bacterium]